MTTNADITIYHRTVDQNTRLDAYDRHTVSRVLWEACKAANVIDSGMEDSDAFRVYVPWVHVRNAVIAVGDIVVRGVCEKEISAEYSVAALLKEHFGFLVTSVDKKDYGSPVLWHYEIGGK